MDVGIAPIARPPLGEYTGKLLDELRTIFVDRAESYADFADNATHCQNIRRALGQESGLKADDFTTNGVELIRHKLARLASNCWNHRDSWIDIAGYALLIAACQDRQVDMLKGPFEVREAEGRMVGWAHTDGTIIPATENV